MSLTTSDVLNYAKEIYGRSNGGGDDDVVVMGSNLRWAQRFCQRYGLGIRYGNVMNRGQLCAASEDKFHSYFDQLHNIITQYSINSSSIINMNETGRSKTQQCHRRKIHPVGTTHPIDRQILSLDHITSVHTHISSGQRLPTFVIYKNSIPKDTNFSSSDFILRSSVSGFINRPLFEDYVNSVLIPFVTSRGRCCPFLLLIDNASPHISYKAFKTCLDNNIHVLSLVPNANAWFQPLDQLFYILKKCMYDIASSLSLLSFGFIVNMKKFLELLRLAKKSAFTKENIKMSFHITGISPFNPSIAIEKSNVRPSIENVENCPEKEPCSTCGRIDPCPECLICNNPLAKTNTLTNNICKEILQLPSNPSKTPSNPRKSSSSTHYTHPDNLRNLAEKQQSPS